MRTPVTTDPVSSRSAMAPQPPQILMESIGMRLRRARIQRGLSIDGISRTTRISLTQLQSLEKGRYDDLPGEAYTRGFVRSVAQAVGIDSNDALAHYASERRSRTTTLHPAERIPEKKGRRVGLLVACSVFLLLLVVATLAVTRPRQHAAPALSLIDTSCDVDASV